MNTEGMSPEQVKILSCLGLANSIDPRVQMNIPTRDLWFKVLRGYEYPELHAAIELYHERPAPDRGRPVIEAPMIRKIIQDEQSRATAQESAQRALPAASPAASFRSRDPAEWERLVAKGRDEHREDLRRRNIPLTEWQLAHRPKPKPTE